MPKAETCIVCGAFSHSAPMTAHTHGAAELYYCDNAEWCQLRAAANAVEALGFFGVATDDADD